MKRTTLVSLARAVGVSRTTASNAYSRPEKLSPQLRERILDTARRLGYDGPSPLAASLRTGRTDTLGVLFTDELGYAFSDPVAMRFLGGVADRAQQAGYAVTVLSAPRSGGAGPVSKAVFDGLIIYSVDADSAGLAAAAARGLPAVLVDQPPQPDVPCVNITDRAGAAAAMTHLVDLGHRRIAAVAVAAGPPSCQLVGDTATSANHVVRERLAGWRLAAPAGHPPLTVSCPTNAAEHGRHAARLLLAAGPRPTAIVCLSDELALGVLAELAAQGVAVPARMSVVGFDDSPAASHVHPALTTVHQPARDKGRTAANLLLDRLGGDPPAPAAHTLPTRLVVRASTGPPG